VRAAFSMLQKVGLGVHLPGNGEVALALGAGRRYDPMPVDEMPMLDGLAVARALRGREAGEPSGMFRHRDGRKRRG